MISCQRPYLVEPTLLRAPGFRHAATAHELFSPVAHLVRYEEGELDAVVDDINRTVRSGGIIHVSMVIPPNTTLLNMVIYQSHLL